MKFYYLSYKGMDYQIIFVFEDDLVFRFKRDYISSQMKDFWLDGMLDGLEL